MSTSCPECEAPAKSVPVETVRALTITPDVSLGDEWRFCGTLDCPVVYFAGDTIVEAEQVSVVPFQKSTDAERLVCFCFGHSVAELQEDLAAYGESRIREEIKRRCKAGEDECRTRNPQGRCCLGNVGSVLRSPRESNDSCCETECSASEPDSTVRETPSSERADGRAGFGAAIGLAALSSACCWIPALGFALGVSTAGIGAMVAPWRVPALLLAVFIVAGTVVYRVRARRRACAAEGCEPSSPGWFAPVLILVAVLILGLYPVYASTDVPEPAPAATPVTVELTYGIDGMTCGGCESHVEGAFASIEGVATVDASYEDGSVVVGWVGEPDLADIDNALSELGYARRDLGERP